MSAARSGWFQSVFSLVCRQASSGFPGTPAGKQGRSESGRHSNALPVRIEGASPNRVFRPATFTLRRTKPVASPGPLLPPSLKKIGRAAPVGLGYREKKRYRSPLVSL